MSVGAVSVIGVGAVVDFEWYSTLLQLQAGAVSRVQLTESGWTKSDIKSAVRRKELRRVHPRVYVNHTGPLTFEQRSWAAILYAGRSAICGPTLAAPGTQRESDPIHVAIDQKRRVDPQPGIVLHRMVDLADHMFPDVLPRLRLEDNLLLMAGEANDEIDVIGVLGRGIGRRLGPRARLPHQGGTRPRAPARHSPSAQKHPERQPVSRHRLRGVRAGGRA